MIHKYSTANLFYFSHEKFKLVSLLCKMEIKAPVSEAKLPKKIQVSKYSPYFMMQDFHNFTGIPSMYLEQFDI